MMSFSCDTIWPIRLDISPLECRQILREKELLCYSDVVSVLRAQGPLSDEKKSVLNNLQKLFSISDDRNKAELRRAANNEKLATIAETVSGFDAYAEWAALGALKLPPTIRPIPRTVFCDEACQTVESKCDEEKEFPLPSMTGDVELSEKQEESIASNRLFNKDRRPGKNIHCPTASTNVATNTDSVKNTIKSGASKEGVVASLDYNLHLLSEIATGESETNPESAELDIKPDQFSIHQQIEDIELSDSIISPPLRHHPNINHPIVTPISNTIMLATGVKGHSVIAHDQQQIQTPIMNVANSAVPVVIANNSIGQRYVLPRSTMSQNINFISSSNQQRHQQIPNFMAQQQQQSSQSGTYLALANSQIRSPPSHQLGSTNWTGQHQQQQQQPQQVYIQNVPSHHGLGQPTMESFTSLGYTLQQRAVKAEQHQTNNKQNFIVRNLGSQPSMDPERNKRFMVVKGGSSLGPSTKKPKISNPSNRQPGRPPLMPAPSSAYTSRPYVANEIFHNNRTSINATSTISTDSSLTDSNGLKISSISSGNRSVVSANPSSSSSAAQMRSNSYYPVSRGNGVQRTSSSSSSGSVVQLGSATNLRANEAPSVASSNSLRPKNIQPIISVVPLSPVVTTMGDIITSSNVPVQASYVKDEILEHHMAESVLPVKVISKDEVYASIMDRVNPPSILSLSQTDNKTQ